jgi:nicotinamide-nucleotide amidase
VGVVTPETSRTAEFRFDGDRAQIRAAAVDAVLRTLWDVLRE